MAASGLPQLHEQHAAVHPDDTREPQRRIAADRTASRVVYRPSCPPSVPLSSFLSLRLSRFFFGSSSVLERRLTAADWPYCAPRRRAVRRRRRWRELPLLRPHGAGLCRGGEREAVVALPVLVVRPADLGTCVWTLTSAGTPVRTRSPSSPAWSLPRSSACSTCRRRKVRR